MGWPGGLVEGARASHKVYGAPPSTTLLEAHTRVRDDTTSLAETENSWAEEKFTEPTCQLIKENPAGRGTETSAEVLVAHLYCTL